MAQIGLLASSHTSLYPPGSPVTTYEKILIPMSPKGLPATWRACPLARRNPPNHFVPPKIFIGRKPFTAAQLRTIASTPTPTRSKCKVTLRERPISKRRAQPGFGVWPYHGLLDH